MVLTTAPFSSEARKEAVRDGVPPIELVDGQSLVDMLTALELGLVPRTVYDINEEFFTEFGHASAVRTVAADNRLRPDVGGNTSFPSGRRPR